MMAQPLSHRGLGRLLVCLLLVASAIGCAVAPTPTPAGTPIVVVPAPGPPHVTMRTQRGPAPNQRHDRIACIEAERSAFAGDRADAQRYRRGLAAEARGDFAAAHEHFTGVITDHPRSELRPRAQLAIALLFQHSATPFADTMLERSLALLSVSDPLHTYARYLRGQLAWREDRRREAIHAMVTVTASGEDKSAHPCAKRLATFARSQLVAWVVASDADVSATLASLTSAADSSAPLLVDLARGYVAHGRDEDAVTVLDVLLRSPLPSCPTGQGGCERQQRHCREVTAVLADLKTSSKLAAEHDRRCGLH